MKTWVRLSLILNIAVLIPVCAGILTNAAWAQASYGPATPARGILVAVYVAIGLASVLFLLRNDFRSAPVLLFLQIVYKVLTPFSVGTLHNPVVLSNLAIAAFHALTLFIVVGDRME